MRLSKVVSSSVEAVGYENGMLVVRFKSGEYYIYQGVPESKYEELLKAESVGKFLNESIKPNYTFTHLENIRG